MLPEAAYTQLTPDMNICRLLNGLWQVSGAHGRVDPQAAQTNMLEYHDAGFTTWDLADHYGPAEDFIGEFRRHLLAERESVGDLLACTKWVPRPGRMTRAMVEAAVDVSRRRMAMEKLDLLQFHWWDYRDSAYLDALTHLAALREAGKIRHLALTNFDTERLEIIRRQGIRVVSNQVQYSIIDQRPAVKMAAWCVAHDVKLLAYGTVCGGLLSEKYIGAVEPDRLALDTASLRKYKSMIDTCGGWALFQQLLTTLKSIADKHAVSIANIAVRFVLDQPAVAGVIVGARLGVADHRTENARVFDFALDDDDRAQIQAITAQSRDLFRLIGDCGDEYRR